MFIACLVTTSEHGGGVGAIPTVGQGSGVKGGVGKKKSSGRSVSQQGGTTTEEKDTDGSFRVPGYRGVWVNKNGKHFVKIDGNRLTEDRKEGGKLRLFDHIDDAARIHDKIAQKEENGEKIEVNFKADGSRIIYEDITPAPTSGLGGSAANVVPALSVINIKVSLSFIVIALKLYKRRSSLTDVFLTTIFSRIYHQMLNLCCEIHGRLRVQAVIQRGTSMLTEGFVGKHEKDTIVGKVKYRLWV